MRLSVFLFIVFFMGNIQAQSNSTFSEMYFSWYAYDIEELTDGSFIFLTQKNSWYDINGIRLVRINNQGEILDSVSHEFEANYAHRTPTYGTYAFINDSTFLTSITTIHGPTNDWINTLVKYRIYNNMDTIVTQKLEVNYPDSIFSWNSWRLYDVTSINKLQNGNFMLSGSIRGERRMRMPYFIEIDEDLNIIKDFMVYDTILSYNVHDFIELNDGSFLITSLCSFYGDYENVFENRSVVARIDSTGNFIWRNVMPIGAPSDRNFWLYDKPPSIALTSDSTIGMAYFQHLACPDSAGHNSCSRGFSNTIVGRYRFVSFNLDGNVLVNKPISHYQTVVWNGPPVTTNNLVYLDKENAFLFTGNHVVNNFTSNAGFVYKLSEQGDSIWLREPRLRLANPTHTKTNLHITKPTSDGGYAGIGIVFHNMDLSNPYYMNNSTRTFVFKLDSNGCYEPGICPNSVLNVEKAFSSVDGVKIYPNPADRILNIELEGIQGECRVVLRNMQGQTIVTQTLDDTYGSNAKTEFDVQHIASGLYIVEVHGRQGLLQTKKVIINP